MKNEVESLLDHLQKILTAVAILMLSLIHICLGRVGEAEESKTPLSWRCIAEFGSLMIFLLVQILVSQEYHF